MLIMRIQFSKFWVRNFLSQKPTLMLIKVSALGANWKFQKNWTRHIMFRILMITTLIHVLTIVGFDRLIFIGCTIRQIATSCCVLKCDNQNVYYTYGTSKQMIRSWYVGHLDNDSNSDLLGLFLNNGFNYFWSYWKFSKDKLFQEARLGFSFSLFYKLDFDFWNL